MALVAFEQLLSSTGALQNWGATLAFESALVHHLNFLTSPADKRQIEHSLLEPTSCRVTRAAPPAKCSRLSFSFLIVVTTHFDSLHLVRAQWDLWMSAHQHLVVSDHRRGSPEDFLVGMRWGSAMAMKSLAGISCAHSNRIAPYDVMLVIDDDTGLRLRHIDAALFTQRVSPGVPRLLSLPSPSQAAAPQERQRKETRLTAKGKDVEAYHASVQPLRSQPCPQLSTSEPCLLDSAAALPQPGGNGTQEQHLAGMHTPHGPWPAHRWGTASFAGGGEGMAITHAGVAALLPFVPGCLQCLTCPFFGASNAKRSSFETQRGGYTTSANANGSSAEGTGGLGRVPPEVRAARDAADRLLGFGSCPPEAAGSGKAPRCAGTDTQVGMCWARAGYVPQALTLPTAQSPPVSQESDALPAAEGLTTATLSKHLAGVKHNQTQFRAELARLAACEGVPDKLSAAAIPPILWFTYKSSLLWGEARDGGRATLTPLEHLLAANVANTLAVHPGARLRFADDRACHTMLQRAEEAVNATGLSAAFRSETDGSYRGDLCRGAALFLHGGWYSDVDVQARLNWREAVPEDTSFVAVRDGGGTREADFFNAVIAAAPGHRVVRCYLQWMAAWYHAKAERVPLAALLRSGRDVSTWAAPPALKARITGLLDVAAEAQRGGPGGDTDGGSTGSLASNGGRGGRSGNAAPSGRTTTLPASVSDPGGIPASGPLPGSPPALLDELKGLRSTWGRLPGDMLYVAFAVAARGATHREARTYQFLWQLRLGTPAVAQMHKDLERVPLQEGAGCCCHYVLVAPLSMRVVAYSRVVGASKMCFARNASSAESAQESAAFKAPRQRWPHEIQHT